MTRDQHLEFCGRCSNRKFDSDKGIICGLTNEVAAFQNTCDHYEVDRAFAATNQSVEDIPVHQVVESLPENIRVLLRRQQDIFLALIGGLSAAIVGAIIWASITVATNYQIGYMAIAVGLLVGFSVRYFGAGVDKYFGYIGAVLALLGCALGNLLSQVIFVANADSIGYMDVIVRLNFDLIFFVFAETFSPIDILFYGIAAYEGYKFAFRKITEEIYAAAGTGKLSPLPFGQFRIPIAVVLYIMFAVVGFRVHGAANGERITYYPSGERESSGLLANGRESGLWQFWWENGQLMSKGLFTDGKADSTWEHYSEEGKLYRRASFEAGIEHGKWTDLYEDGTVNSVGNFVQGRKDGEWKFYYENGVLAEKGNYRLDIPDGTWESFYANGKPSLLASYEASEPRNLWTKWNEDGQKVYEFDYGTDGKLTIVNSWSTTGKPEVQSGNGIFNSYYSNGQIIETGMVKNRIKMGTWKTFYENGSKKEVGHFSDDVYYVDTMWTPDGVIQLENGEGLVKIYDTEGNVTEGGKISNGLREGEWITYYPLMDEIVMSTTQYSNGNPEGFQQVFFDDGTLQIEGAFRNGKREGTWQWYHQSGVLESSVDFSAGKKEGVQNFYLDDGTLLRTELYKQGKLMESKTAL